MRSGYSLMAAIRQVFFSFLSLWGTKVRISKKKKNLTALKVPLEISRGSTRMAKGFCGFKQ